MGSIPTTPALIKHGGHGEVVNAPDCGSGMRGFDPHWPPHTICIGMSDEHCLNVNDNKMKKQLYMRV